MGSTLRSPRRVSGEWLVGDTEVQRVSFVGYTRGEDGSSGLWNLQNLHAVPPYSS